jgi:hypothetical protein
MAVEVTRGLTAGTNASVRCRCTEATEFYGEEAERYLADHLQADGDRYVCPDTGRRWRLEQTDAGQPRLVQE